MSGPITRESFIVAEEVLKIATRLPTMWTVDEAGELKEVPVPSSVKETGALPEGYTYDFHLDPLMLVSTLKKAGHRDLSSIDAELLEKVKGIINTETNISIVPISIHESKLKVVEESIAGGDSENSEE